MYGLLRRRAFNSLPVPNDRNGVFVDLICHRPLLELFSSKASLPVQVDGQQQEDEKKNPSFTVSYLVNSCGLSAEKASSISKNYRIDSPEGPNSVLSLLREYGFSNTQISRVIGHCPQVIFAHAEKTLVPKLQFFLSIRGSRPETVDILSRYPSFFIYSLDKKILPFYNFLKNEVCLDDDKVVSALYGIFRTKPYDALKVLLPNIALLKGLGVPQSSISIFLTCHRGMLNKDVEEFSEQAQKVVKMGFCPSTLNFVQAMSALFAQKSSTWEHKMEVYRSWGWSDDEIWSAFTKQPICMTLSEKNIMSTMDFLVNKVGMKSSAVSKRPILLLYSLNKWLVPRFNVITLLQSKGLIEKNMHFDYVVSLSKRCFMDKFVTKYVDDVPQLLKIVGGQMNLKELDIGSQQLVG